MRGRETAMEPEWRDLPWVGEGVKNICFVWRVLLLPTFSPSLMGGTNSALAFRIVFPQASDQFRWTVSQVKSTAASVFCWSKMGGSILAEPKPRLMKGKSGCS